MTSEWSWVIAAYTLAWLVLGVYAILTLRRRRRAEDELAVVRAEIRQQSEVQA